MVAEQPIAAADMPLDAASGMMSELGSSRTGVDYMGISIRDPLREWQGGRGARIAQEMIYNEAIVGALLMAVEMIVRSTTWQAEAPEEFAEDDAEAERYRLHLEQCRDDLDYCTWEDMISDSLMAVGYGWEDMEVTLKQRLGPYPESGPSSKFDDGLIGWHKIAHRDQLGLQRWDIDEHGDVKGFWHRAETQDQEVYIPMWKVVHFQTSHAGGHPEGFSWLRRLYRAWRFKKNLEWLEAVGAERGQAGLPVVRLPMGANTQAGSLDVERAKSLVQNVRTDSMMGVVLPPALGKEEHQKWGFELMGPSGGGGTTSNTKLDETIRRYASEMTTSLLAHFINLGMSTTGAYALSKDQRDLWHLAMSGLLEMWAATINQQLVEPLYEFNLDSFPDRTRWAKFVPSDIAQHDLEKVTAFLTAMLGAGAMRLDDDDRNRVREMLGWPKESQELVDLAAEEQEMKSEMDGAMLEQAKNPPKPAGPPGKVKATEGDEVPISEWGSADWLKWIEGNR